MEPDAFPLGDHMVVEQQGMLACRKCGRTASLGEADKLAETACITTEPHTQPTAPSRTATSCDICKSGTGDFPAPILDPLTGSVNKKQLCNNCFNDYLKILRFAGPRIGRAKARSPPNGVWFSYGENNSTLFQRIGGAWPCPAPGCGEFFENLYDVVIHYSQKHPEIANKPNEKTTIDINGKPVEVLKTSQGYLVCPCGFVADNERHLSYHYSHEHR